MMNLLLIVPLKKSNNNSSTYYESKSASVRARPAQWKIFCGIKRSSGLKFITFTDSARLLPIRCGEEEREHSSTILVGNEKSESTKCMGGQRRREEKKKKKEGKNRRMKEKLNLFSCKTVHRLNI